MRVIPVLLIRDESLVKTVRFGRFRYIGDPCNSARIFNEFEVDELIILDISASKNSRDPNFKLIKEMATECFMPLTYGGGISTVDQAKSVFDCGVEKISINSVLFKDLNLIEEIANIYGEQAVVCSIDVKKNIFGSYYVYRKSKIFEFTKCPIKWAKILENHGAGEILLTSVNREGTWLGYDIEIIKDVTENTSIPVIALGGASSISDLIDAAKFAKPSALGVSSMVSFQKKGMGVLISFPSKAELEELR